MKLFPKGKPTAPLFIATALVILAASGLIWHFLPASGKEPFYAVAALFGGDRDVISSSTNQITITPYPYATRMIAFCFLALLVSFPISLYSIFFPYYWFSEKTGPQSRKFSRMLFVFILLLVLTLLCIAILWGVGAACPTCLGILGMITLPMATGVVISIEILLTMLPLLIIAGFLKLTQKEDSFSTATAPRKDTLTANRSQKSSNTITPLLGAIISGDLDLVRTALQQNPEHLNTSYAQNGNTPLHVAALNGQAEIVTLLLEQPGIDKTLKNNDGKTAADLAQEKGFTEIVQLLN